MVGTSFSIHQQHQHSPYAVNAAEHASSSLFTYRCQNGDDGHLQLHRLMLTKQKETKKDEK
jgi:hypothetical protein